MKAVSQLGPVDVADDAVLGLNLLTLLKKFALRLFLFMGWGEGGGGLGGWGVTVLTTSTLRVMSV